VTTAERDQRSIEQEPSPPSERPSTYWQTAAERRHAALFLISGAGLVLHLLLPLPLPVTIGFSLVAAVAAVWFLQAPGVQVGEWPGATLLRVGFVTSIAAVAAYDGSRLILVELGQFEVSPFDAFQHFGSALIGESRSLTARWVAGTAFHLTNAVGFSLAFVFLFRDRGLWWGIGWGLALEAMMLGLYPRWLQIRQLEEFVTMSVVGHIAFGATLGLVSRHLLRKAKLDDNEPLREPAR